VAILQPDWGKCTDCLPGAGSGPTQVVEMCAAEQIQQDVQMKTNEIQREGRKKDKLERELRQAKADLDAKVADIKNLHQTLEYSSSNIAKLNGDLKDQKVWPALFTGLSSLFITICDFCNIFSAFSLLVKKGKGSFMLIQWEIVEDLA